MAAHTGFILAAYAAAALVLGGLTASILLDHRRQARLLAALEQRGVGRSRETR